MRTAFRSGASRRFSVHRALLKAAKSARIAAASCRIPRCKTRKIDFERGWVHLRKSNTEPIIRIYSEAKDEAAANALAEEVIEAAKQLC